MTTGAPTQANMNIVNYVEKLLDDRHFSVRLNANFLCHFGRERERKSVGLRGRLNVRNVKKKIIYRQNVNERFAAATTTTTTLNTSRPTSSAQTIWFAISHLSSRKSYSRKSKSVCDANARIPFSRGNINGANAKTTTTSTRTKKKCANAKRGEDAVKLFIRPKMWTKK